MKIILLIISILGVVQNSYANDEKGIEYLSCYVLHKGFTIAPEAEDGPDYTLHVKEVDYYMGKATDAMGYYKTIMALRNPNFQQYIMIGVASPRNAIRLLDEGCDWRAVKSGKTKHRY